MIRPRTAGSAPGGTPGRGELIVRGLNAGASGCGGPAVTAESRAPGSVTYVYERNCVANVLGAARMRAADGSGT